MKQTTTNGLALLSLVLTAASCQAAISPCISGGGWSFHINTNYNVDDNNGNDIQCTYEVAKDAFEEEVFSQSLLLKDGCSNTVEEEFFAQLGVETSEDAEAAVYALCGSAQKNMRKYPLSDVTYNKGSQYLELYYSGRSAWNEETETLLFPSDGQTAVQNLKQDSALVKGYYEISKASAFEMPDLPQFEPDQCASHTAMCCWPRDRQANDNNGNCNKEYDENCVDKDVADNTDLCYVELGHAPYSSGVDANGFSLFPNDNNNGEGAIHCHGFAWALDDQETLSRYKANNLFYVSMYDHMYTRGYVENIPGSPMCGCVEDMPVVSRSDCTQTNLKEYYVFTKKVNEPSFNSIVDSVRLDYQACQGANNKNNDLSAFVQQLVNDEKITTNEQDIVKTRIVGKGQCNNAITSGLESNNFTKGFDIDSSKWTFIAGEGFPGEDRIKDARLFKEMFEAQDQSMQIVRRVCPSCDATHKDIYYRRLTSMPDGFDLLDTLMNNWFDTANELNVDFALYSSYMDAYYDQNRWTFCNFNDPGIGFPRDCGPKGRVNNNWNSYYLGGGRANHHAFLLPNDPSFNSQIINIANEKHATVEQSSSNHGGVAERAVDGDTVGIWNWGSTTHTRSESNPWWQVSFDYNTAVGKVYFWNRLDCCRERLSDVRVSLYDGKNEVSFKKIEGTSSVMNVVDFEGAFGQTVRISLPSGGTLSLAEVQVEGLVHTPAPTISAVPSSSPAPTQVNRIFLGTDYIEEKGTGFSEGSTTIGWFDSGDYLTYGSVTFGPSGTTTGIRINYSKGTDGGSVELRLGKGTTGTLIGEFHPASTRSWGKYLTAYFDIGDVSGTHDITFVGKGISSILNLAWFELANFSERSDVYSRIPASEYSDQKGVQFFETGHSAPYDYGIGWYDTGDFMTYANVNFGPIGTSKSIKISFAKGNNGGTVIAKLGGADGTQIGQFTPNHSGGWDSWAVGTITLDIDVDGIHDLTFVGTGGSGVLNLQWFELAAL